MQMYYLDKHKVAHQTTDYTKFNTADEKRVANDTNETYRVSTVFLGVDHRFGDGPPLIFETMVFKRGEWEEQDCQRYSTWAEAEQGHRDMCRKWKVSPDSLGDPNTTEEADAIYELFLEDDDD